MNELNELAGIRSALLFDLINLQKKKYRSEKFMNKNAKKESKFYSNSDK